MDWVVAIFKALIFGFLCAIPFISIKRYILRTSLSMIAPPAIIWWMIQARGASSVFEYFEINRRLLIEVSGGFCAAQVRSLWAARVAPNQEKTALTDPLKGLPLIVGLILSLASVISVMLLKDWYSGEIGEGSPDWEFERYVYLSIQIIFLFVASSSAWLRRLDTTAFIWACVLGGYLGSLFAFYYSDIEGIKLWWSESNYHYGLLETLTYPAHGFAGIAGALAALTMFGASRAYVELRSLWM